MSKEDYRTLPCDHSLGLALGRGLALALPHLYDQDIMLMSNAVEYF